MLSHNVREALSLLRIYAYLFYRKIELRILFRKTRAKTEDVTMLATRVGRAFYKRTPDLSGVEVVTLKDMGYPQDADGNNISPLCWNAPIAITIHLNGEPYFGLGVEFRRHALCIRQMQGVRGKMPPEGLRDWPEIFVRACIEGATLLHFKEVRIYKADQDVNFHLPILKPQKHQSEEEADKIHQNRMRRRYDRTAQKFKFTKKKRYYVWKVTPQVQSH